jgi:hypothetical protein
LPGCAARVSVRMGRKRTVGGSVTLMSDIRFLTTGVHEGIDRISVYIHQIYRADFLSDKVLITFMNGTAVELNKKYEADVRFQLHSFMPIPNGLLNKTSLTFSEFQFDEKMGGSYPERRVRFQTIRNDEFILIGTDLDNALAQFGW